MESKTPVKFTKYLLMLQTLVVTGIAICEVIQIAEINKKPITDPNDWDYLLGYTDNKLTVVMKIYYWFILIISIGILGWSLKSFERRWKNIQNYDDKLTCVTLLTLWCVATIPSVILLFSSKGLRKCQPSTTTTNTVLNNCHAYLASLVLAYVLIITLIIQLLYNFIILRHQKQNIIPCNIQEPKKLKITRSRHVSRKRRSKDHRASVLSTLSNGTRLSVVTEDDEDDRSFKSAKSYRSEMSEVSNKSDKSHEIIQIEKPAIKKNEKEEVHVAKVAKRVSFNV